MKHFRIGEVAITNPQGSSVKLTPEKSIVLTSDIVAYNRREDVPTLEVQYDPSRVTVAAESAIIASFHSPLREGLEYSVVYGERLVEVLEWIVQTLMTHSHPPNAPAIPDFHPQANSYLATMEDYLLNRNVRTR